MIKYAGFIDGANTNNDYEYDTFGNMLLDRNKGITSIEYNHLNLPRRINFATGGNIIYIYNAQGVKLQKTVSYPNQTQATTRYRGGFQYDNQTLQFVQTPEGYVRHTPNPTNGSVYGAFDYVYNYTDHLGNIRLSYVLDPFSQELKVMEENHYYPFGLKHSYNLNKRDIGYFDHLLAGTLDPTEDTRRTRMVGNNGYQYRYNGKEYQDELGLNFYDYGARNYDPAIGRWMNIDPLAEEGRRWSPYNYAMDNPIYFVDPDGMLSQSFLENLWNKSGKGETKWTNNNDGSFSDDNGNSVDSGDNSGSESGDPQKKGGLEEIVTIKGKKYHKNTHNLPATIGNKINSLFGGDSDYFVEHKPYDPVEENILNETINTGTGFIIGGIIGNAVSKNFSLLGRTTSGSGYEVAYTVVRESSSKFSVICKSGSAREFFKILNPSWNGTFSYTQGAFSTTSFTTKEGIKVIFNTTSNSTGQASIKIISKEAQILFRFPNL